MLIIFAQVVAQVPWTVASDRRRGGTEAGSTEMRGHEN
jgi:hypothetical protein